MSFEQNQEYIRDAVPKMQRLTSPVVLEQVVATARVFYPVSRSSVLLKSRMVLIVALPGVVRGL